MSKSPSSEDDDFFADLDQPEDNDDAKASSRASRRSLTRMKDISDKASIRSSFTSDLGNEELRQKIRELERENAILKRNISTLYRTSREEIKRKDLQITALQENELDVSFQMRK